MTERYTREEVDAILGRAIERDRSNGDLSREQLVAVAREVGVSAESVEKAIDEIFAERSGREELAQLRRQAWRGFLFHLIPYVCVCTLLVVLNLATTSFPWALFPIMGWGIGVLSHLMSVAFPNPERLQRQLERRRERERRRQYRRQVSVGAKELEVAVGEGVAALLHAAADRVNRGTAPTHFDVKRRVQVDVDVIHSDETEFQPPHPRPTARRGRES
ncbi:MAG TPA: 2TM domain-containing protein [Polyangiaceae bacterium]|nr:2TM domain-containing protein [Polyangiaceae bacterium]